MEETSKKTKTLRLITGWIISLLALACLFLGGFPIFAFLMVIICLGAKEYVKILQAKGFHPSLSLIVLCVLVLAILVFTRQFSLLPLVISAGVIGSFLIVLFMGRQPYIVNVATTVLGFLYCGWLPCHILLIRQFGANRIGALHLNLNEGLWLTILVFLIVVATDIGGYYFGSKFGKRKLAAVISPKKTVEGSIGASIVAILVALCGVFYTNLNLVECLITGVLVTTFAQLGDLSESLVKRDAGVKDSSNILPGHGGVLDRCDSYLFALPVAYYYFVTFTHGNNVLRDIWSFIAGIINVYFG